MAYGLAYTLTPESDNDYRRGRSSDLSLLFAPSRGKPSDICAKTQRELQQRVLLPNFTAFPNSFTWCKGTTFFLYATQRNKLFKIIYNTVIISKLELLFGEEYI